MRSSLVRVRGLLVVNPQATTTSPRTADIIVSALSAQLDLDVVPTAHRDHARELGEQARRDGLDVIVTFGGDGTVNEVVNGLMTHHGDADPTLDTGSSTKGPILAPLPGGSANVFARALGLPREPVEAAGEILACLRDDSTRPIGLGRAHITNAAGHRSVRWFTANAGFGIDAGVIQAMEAQRARGHAASPARYLRTAVQQYMFGFDRSQPALTVRRGDEVVEGVYWAIVQNTSPWTYLGAVPVDACPDASFDTGLDLFALRRMGLFAATRAARRLLAHSRAGSTKRSITTWHDTSHLLVTAAPASVMQADGELIGPVTDVAFTAVGDALWTVSPER